MYFGKSSLFSFESRACHQTGVFELLQVNSQLSSCLADIRDYGVSTSTPGRNDEEIKAVLGKLPFLPCWSFLVLITCFLYALCKRFFPKQSSSFEAIGCRTGSSSSIRWPAGESSPIVLAVGKQVLLGRLSGGDERLDFLPRPRPFDNNFIRFSISCCFILTNLRGKLKRNSETRYSVNLASSPLSFEIVAVFPDSRGCHPR